MIPPIGVKIFAWDTLSPKLTQIQSRLKTFGTSANTVGRTMTMGISLPLALVGGAAVKMSTDFNAAMANVGTLIPGNQKRLEELKKGVQALAIETGKSTGDLAGGLFQVISAFGDTNETMAKLRTVAIGAVAGISETSDALRLASLITKSYGDVTDKATQHVFDLAFKANELGQTTFPEMATAMGPMVPLAEALGVKVEELFGVMGTFTGVTGNTSEVTTQLRSVLGALIKPTADMSAALQILGVRSGKELIQTKGLHGAMKALVKVTEPYPGILGKVMGRKEALTLMLSATGKQADVFSEKLEKMMNVQGATGKAFHEQTQGINKAGFAFKQFQQRFAVIAQKFGDAVAPMLTKMLEQLEEFVDWLDKLSPKTKEFIFVIGGLTAAIGPLILAISALTASLNILAANPVVVFLIALVGIFAAMAYWWERLGPLGKVMMTSWMGPLGSIFSSIRTIKQDFKIFVDFLKDAWNWIKLVGVAISNLDFGMLGRLFTHFGSAEGFEKGEAEIGQAELNRLFGITAPLPVSGKIELEYKGPPLQNVEAYSPQFDFDISERGYGYEF